MKVTTEAAVSEAAAEAASITIEHLPLQLTALFASCSSGTLENEYFIDDG